MTELPALRMTCAELVELVTEYHEGTLRDEDRLRFEAHVAACRECSAHLEQIRLTVGALGFLREDDVPAEAIDGLMGAFRHWRA